MPEKQAMRMESGYTPASHMSCTLLARVKEKMEGNCTRGASGGMPHEMLRYTLAPTDRLLLMNSAMLDSSSSGTTRARSVPTLGLGARACEYLGWLGSEGASSISESKGWCSDLAFWWEEEC